MKAKNISYPYPVLGNQDDVRGEFDVSFKHALRKEEITLKAAFKLKNKTLENLVRDNKAAYTIELECPGTFYRKSFSTHDSEAQFSIPASAVREQVAVGFYIRAISSISKYQIDNCHADYKGFRFEVGAGDVLALGGFTSFIAEKDFDPMRPAVSSLIAIKPGTHSAGPMVIDYSKDKIFIKLSKADHENYVAMKGRTTLAGVLHASIVLPVLADAVRLVGNSDEESQGTHWFKRLDIILRQLQLSSDEPLESAQKILKSPVERCLSGLVSNEEE